MSVYGCLSPCGSPAALVQAPIADQKLARGLVAEEVRTHFQSTAKVPSSIVPDPQINGAHVWGSLLALTLPPK